MNCCDEYGDCRQGRDCPARVAKVGQRTHAKTPLPASAWHAYLHHLAKWMLIALGAVLIAAMWLALIAASHRWAPTERFIDCSLSEFHPDYSPAVREVCRKKAMRKL